MSRELPKKVVYLELLDSLIDADGGQGRAHYRLGRDFPWLFSEGWEIERWGLRRRKTGASRVEPGSLRGPTFPFLVFPRVLLPVVVWGLQFVQSLVRPRAGIFVAYSPIMGTGAAMALWPRRRSVLVVRIISDFSTRAHLLYGRRREARILRALERFVLRRADLALPMSSFAHEIALRAGVPEERILELPHRAPAFGTGVTPTQRADPARVVGAGRLVPEKGFDLLVLAFAEIADEFPDVLLEIAGDGPQLTSLEKLAASLGISERVRFRGWIQNYGMPGFFAGAQAAVLPSRSNEGLGMVLVEAGLAGCALVGTDVGGIRDIVQPDRTGILVPPNDYEGLSIALRTILGDPELARRLGEGAQSEARAYVARWDEAVQRVRERVNALRLGQ